MVSSSLCLLNSPVCPHSLPNVSSQPLLSFSRSLRPFLSKSKPLASQKKKRDNSGLLVVKSQALDFSGTFFEGGFGSDDDPTSPSVSTALEDKPEPQCPPGLRQYETMAVLRPDMSEDERLGLTQKYEEVIIHKIFMFSSGKVERVGTLFNSILCLFLHIHYNTHFSFV